MKKVLFSIALTFGLMATSTQAQSLQSVEKPEFATSSNRALPSVSIWFGRGGCNPGFGICRIDIGKSASSRLDPNQLTGNYFKNIDGTTTLELDGNKNRAFVDKLKANGKLELDKDYTFTAEEAQKLFGTTEVVTLKASGYDFKSPKSMARTAGGSIEIRVGKLVIIIKW
jgi:hypothetical protein